MLRNTKFIPTNRSKRELGLPVGTPKILPAKCDRQCLASNSGCCCHVMALIWTLEDMTRKSELKNITPDNRCCTSKPREWGKGSKREVEFTPMMASKITKPRHASDLPGRKRRSIESQFCDPRPSKFQKLDVDGIIKLRQDLQEINANIPFCQNVTRGKHNSKSKDYSWHCCSRFNNSQATSRLHPTSKLNNTRF